MTGDSSPALGDHFGGHRHGRAITAAPPARWVFCAGQASIDADGTVPHADDIGAQLTQSFNNLDTVRRAPNTTSSGRLLERHRVPETLHTSSDLLIFMDKATERVSPSDGVHLGCSAQGEWS
jgi:hypothetical protein